MTRSTPPFSAYDEDFFSWTQEQAVALRRSAGRMLDDVDVEHLAEEIEDLGKRDLREVKSFLRLLLWHLMKIAASPKSHDVPHWRSEALEFLYAVQQAFSPRMRQLIDMEILWRAADRRSREDCRGTGLPPPEIGKCPFVLDDLLSESFDFDGAVGRVASARTPRTAEISQPPR